MQNDQTMRNFVAELLNDNLPAFCSYHNLDHTLYVVDKSIEIGKKENCTEEELKLISAAALWHDTGFIRTYLNHEEESCLLAKEHLPVFGFSAYDIEVICGIIEATRIPQNPKNKVEEIVADADLEYLGTENAFVQAELLYKEWKHLDHSLTREEWNRKQIAFLESHHYCTAFCKKHREPAKLLYLNSLKKLISAH